MMREVFSFRMGQPRCGFAYDRGLVLRHTVPTLIKMRLSIEVLELSPHRPYALFENILDLTHVCESISNLASVAWTRDVFSNGSRIQTKSNYGAASALN